MSDKFIRAFMYGLETGDAVDVNVNGVVHTFTPESAQQDISVGDSFVDTSSAEISDLRQFNATQAEQITQLTNANSEQANAVTLLQSANDEKDARITLLEQQIAAIPKADPAAPNGNA